MAASNHITKVAIVGAGGNVGAFITSALLATGKHTITALTRADSQSKLPEGIISIPIDYSKPETLVKALRGQDALVITLWGYAPKETESQLIHAAGEAGVSWILPNEWSPDSTNEGLVRDVFVFQPKMANRKAIAELGKSSYISVLTGFWYEWSLAIPNAFGFDFAKKEVTFFDEGETKLSISTWPQVGRAVAALLSLPIKPQGSKASACLEKFKNQVIYVNSFTINQQDMLASALRVTGTKKEDWKITKEPAKERYESGTKEMGEGSIDGFVKMMYTRVFYKDGCGDFEERTVNKVLGLEKEDIDAATERAIERSKTLL